MMTNLHIAGTQSAPFIAGLWDAGLLEMRGDSYPENSYEFFRPIIDWIEAYLAETDASFRMELHLLYLNTSSVKAMMDIFDLLEEAHAAGRSVSVRWYYDRENERIAELAEEFREDCTFPFEILSHDERPSG